MESETKQINGTESMKVKRVVEEKQRGNSVAGKS